jgi:hypothetical protein
MNTVVTRGRGVLLVTATGRGTQMGHVAGMLEETVQPSTPLQRQLESETQDGRLARRWTRQEYERMVEAGILGRGLLGELESAHRCFSDVRRIKRRSAAG